MRALCPEKDRREKGHESMCRGEPVCGKERQSLRGKKGEHEGDEKGGSLRRQESMCREKGHESVRGKEPVRRQEDVNTERRLDSELAPRNPPMRLLAANPVLRSW
ncbi:MAG: hypothetical protein ACMG6H_13980 [Acidobacteriota bacterium]